MAKVEQSIDVNVPLTTAYNQWTQFEEFPQFMKWVKSVRQIDDANLEWTADIAGQEETWTAEIVEQEPDQRISWRATSGQRMDGLVSFARVDDATTRVTLNMDWDPEGVVQSIGAAAGIDDRSVKGDLERFKEFIEARGASTGAWRGEIEEGTPVG